MTELVAEPVAEPGAEPSAPMAEKHMTVPMDQVSVLLASSMALTEGRCQQAVLVAAMTEKPAEMPAADVAGEG